MNPDTLSVALQFLEVEIFTSQFPPRGPRPGFSRKTKKELDDLKNQRDDIREELKKTPFSTKARN